MAKTKKKTAPTLVQHGKWEATLTNLRTLKAVVRKLAARVRVLEQR